MKTVGVLFLLIWGAASPQEGPEEWIRRLYEARDYAAWNKAKAPLWEHQEAASPAIREKLARYLNERRLPGPPAELLKRLDAQAVLELEEFGADARDLLADALRSAEGNRKTILGLLLERAFQKHTAAVPRHFPSATAELVSLLSYRSAPEDERLLLDMLRDRDDDVRTAALRGLSRRGSGLTEEGWTTVFAAADLRPVTLGRELWGHLPALQNTNALDLRSVFREGGPWARAFAALRLNDPGILEKACADPSPYVRATVVGQLNRDALPPQTWLGILKGLAEDPSEEVRDAVRSVIRFEFAGVADVRLLLALSEPRTNAGDLVFLVLHASIPPAEATLLRVQREKRDDLILELSPILDPARYPALRDPLLESRARATGENQRRFSRILARYGHEIGLVQFDADLKSDDPQVILSALDEIEQWRLAPLAGRAWDLVGHPNSAIASAARPAAVVASGADRWADIERLLAADSSLRVRAGKRLSERPRSSDLPVLALLARAPDYPSQHAALGAIEKLNLKEMNEALQALSDSKYPPIQSGVQKILGRVLYPSQLPQTLSDLTAVDRSKRAGARKRFALTDRSGVRFRVVDGAGGLQGKVVEIPVANARALLVESPVEFEEVSRGFVDEPLPRSFLDPAVLLRPNVLVLGLLVVHRGKPEEVRSLYGQAAGLAEPDPLVQLIPQARAVDPGAVDAFVAGWLRRPPDGARKETLRKLLEASKETMEPAARKALLLQLFQDDRPDVHRAAVDLVRTDPALAFPSEAAALWRSGKVTDKGRVLSVLPFSRSPEGEALLKEWLADPNPDVRRSAAQGLGHLLHAEAIPLIGGLIHDWFEQLKWWVAVELSRGIGARQQPALRELEARAPEEKKAILEVLLYLSGDDAYRDRFLANVPDDLRDRRHFLMALEERPGAVDDSLLEAMIRSDKALVTPGDYFTLLHRSDTPKAAALAYQLLEHTLGHAGIAADHLNLGIDLVSRRIGAPAVEVLAESGLRGFPEAIRGLDRIGTEAAVGQLVRMSALRLSPDCTIAAAEALRRAKRYPALLGQARQTLAGATPETPLPTVLLALAYLEGDEGSAETLLAALRQRGLPPDERVAVLQTLLTLPRIPPQIEDSLRSLPPDPGPNGSAWLPELWRVLVLGQPPSPNLAPGSKIGLLLHAHLRDRAAVARIVPTLSVSAYAESRPLIEIVANRPLPTLQDALAWARTASAARVDGAVAEELAKMGYDDPRKALRDVSPVVRANAAWLLTRRAGRTPMSRGPWIEIATLSGTSGARWTLPGPGPEEIKALEK